MHLPVFLIGFFCGPQYGAIGGIIIPLLSSVLTGMPPVFPMLPIMMGELFAYGFISGLLYKKLKLPIYPSLLIAMLCGRVIYGLIFTALLTANNGNMKALSVTEAIVMGIPGIIIQLVLIPVIVTAVNKFYLHENHKEINDSNEILNRATQMIKEEIASCIIIKNNTIIHTAKGPGVAPLIALYENNPEMLKDSYIVDKVIGKAAAMIAVLGGANKVYGHVMSKAAQSYLKERNIITEYGRCVEVISNRTGDGLCPLEKSIMDVEDAKIGYLRLKDTIRKFSKAV
jgi:hypothetical protein